MKQAKNKMALLDNETVENSTEEIKKVEYTVELLTKTHLILSDNDGNGIRIERNETNENLKTGDKLTI